MRENTKQKIAAFFESREEVIVTISEPIIIDYGKHMTYYLIIVDEGNDDATWLLLEASGYSSLTPATQWKSGYVG